MIAQGDVLLVPAKLPKDAERVEPDGKYIVLAYGEVTGHAHVIEAGVAELMRTAQGDEYINVTGKADLEHVNLPTDTPTKEHDPVKLDKKPYRVIHQREQSPLEGVRRVMD